ncbi:MAG: hypothetical protein HOK63_06275 [Thaumarchaeota archaeon]|nr:hypothetical protein [Nitrososphaerota archaeon]
MASDSATLVPTQQSVKAYVDTRAINNLTDAKLGGTNFANSMMMGHTTTGTLDNALRNTAVGIDSMSAITSGDDNTIIGYDAGDSITTGSTNTVIGSTADVSGANASNQTAIGYGSVCVGNNEVSLGNADVENLRCATATIASISDERDKTDVVDLPWGLDFVDTLRPVQFTWDRRVLSKEDENHKLNGTKRAGFLAQDFQRAMPNGENEILDLVYDVRPERIEAKYGSLIPMLTQAIKDLKAQNEALMARVEALENMN